MTSSNSNFWNFSHNRAGYFYFYIISAWIFLRFFWSNKCSVPKNISKILWKFQPGPFDPTRVQEIMLFWDARMWVWLFLRREESERFCPKKTDGQIRPNSSIPNMSVNSNFQIKKLLNLKKKHWLWWLLKNKF